MQLTLLKAEAPNKLREGDKTKHVRHIVRVSFFIALFVVLSLCGCKTDGLTTVTEVIDGDTIVVESLEAGVRLIGIDAPELRDGSKPAGQYAQEARLFILESLKNGNSKVKLELHGKDSYGRNLAYVFTPDGKMLNTELLRNGLARPLTYEETSHYNDKIVSAYHEAFKNRKGIFSSYNTLKTIEASKIKDNLKPYSQGGFLGKIVWVEFLVTDTSRLSISGKDIIVKIRQEEADLFMPEGFDFNKLYRKTVRVYGEVWEDSSGKASILLRDPAIEIGNISDFVYQRSNIADIVYAARF